VIGVPDSWVTASVGELGQVVSGGTPSTRVPEYWGGNVVWITPADLSGFRQKRISQGARCITRKGLANSSARLMPPGSILFSSRAPVGYVAIADVELCTNQGFKSLVPANGVSSDYLYYYFMSIRELATSRASGTTFKELSAKGFASLPVFIPSLVEQRAIVAKIEELFSELDKGIEQLQTVKQQLNQYRQAVLKAAFEGKLTAEWRAEQQAAGNLPDADELLEQIKKEREERYQQQLQEWKQAVVEWEEAGGRESGRKKPRRPAAPELISLLTEEEMADLAELPQSWVWCRPSDICAPDDYSLGIGPFGSNLKVSDYTDSGVPLIFVRNITGRSFAEFQHFVSYSKAEMLVPHSVYPLDLLITKMGDPPGDVAIYPEGCPPAILTADCVKFRVWNEFVLRDFVALSVESQLVRRQLGLITKGVAQKKISLGRFKSVCFPLPCKSEQQQIVAQLSSRFSVLDELDKAVDHGLELAEALRQSILKKAFEGRLLTEAELAAVRNDPEYESADKLLERIRAQAGKTTR
jgi:type I restriction enzyme S subunit